MLKAATHRAAIPLAIQAVIQAPITVATVRTTAAMAAKSLLKDGDTMATTETTISTARISGVVPAIRGVSQDQGFAEAAPHVLIHRPEIGTKPNGAATHFTAAS